MRDKSRNNDIERPVLAPFAEKRCVWRWLPDPLSPGPVRGAGRAPAPAPPRGTEPPRHDYPPLAESETQPNATAREVILFALPPPAGLPLSLRPAGKGRQFVLLHAMLLAGECVELNSQLKIS